MFLCSLLFRYGFYQKGRKMRECACSVPTHPQGEFLRNSNRLLRRAYPLSRETRCVFTKHWRNRGYRGTADRALLVGAYTFFLKVYGKIPDFPDYSFSRLYRYTDVLDVLQCKTPESPYRQDERFFCFCGVPEHPISPVFTEDKGVFAKY